MFNLGRKYKIYFNTMWHGTGLFLIVVALVVCSCKPPTDNISSTVLNGKTMGTTFSIKYVGGPPAAELVPLVDTLLYEVNQQLSTYISDSDISKFNTESSPLLIDEREPDHFKNVFIKAKEVYHKSRGNFEPTVMPLVNYWGFGYTEKKAVSSVDSFKVDSLKNYVGFDKIFYYKVIDSTGGNHLVYELYEKEMPEIQLDFSAIAKGYGVDQLGEILEDQGCTNYLVEIGGEVRARGKNSRGEIWTTGISRPDPEADANDIQNALRLNNSSLATSGNYRNYYEVNGTKYAHTIDPKSGYPAENTLLSASVIAKDCMTADAFATAFMVMGLDNAMKLAESESDLEAYFIFNDNNGNMKVKYTAGLSQLLLNK